MLIYDITSKRTENAILPQHLRAPIGQKLSGGRVCCHGGRVFISPGEAEHILIYDIASGKASGIPVTSFGRWNYSGICTDGKNVYVTPCRSQPGSNMLIFDIASDTLSAVDLPLLFEKPMFSDACCTGGKVYAVSEVPCENGKHQMMIYDTSSGRFSEVDILRRSGYQHITEPGVPTQRFSGICCGDGKVYVAPCTRRDNLMIYNIATGVVAGIDVLRFMSKIEWPGRPEFTGICYAGGKVFAAPGISQTLLIYNTVTGRVSGVPTGNFEPENEPVGKFDSRYFGSICVAGQRVYAQPTDAGPPTCHMPVFTQPAYMLVYTFVPSTTCKDAVALPDLVAIANLKEQRERDVKEHEKYAVKPQVVVRPPAKVLPSAPAPVSVAAILIENAKSLTAPMSVAYEPTATARDFRRQTDIDTCLSVKYKPMASYHDSPPKGKLLPCSTYIKQGCAEAMPEVQMVDEQVAEASRAVQSLFEDNQVRCLMRERELSAGMVLAIFMFTFDLCLILTTVEDEKANFYYQFNIQMRKRSAEFQRAMHGYLYYFMTGLVRLPSYAGSKFVYRGIDKEGAMRIRQDYIDGRRIHWSSASSATPEACVESAKKFARRAGPGGLLMRIKLLQTDSRVRDIRMFSAFPDEDEVLLLPNFASVVDGTSRYDAELGFEVLDLKECLEAAINVF